ncbi:MFS transporter [Deinococcus cellulosilyticus]|uniref:MFS transporter n=1 Tax=Deinococcus cellulosilyticus (strain DSM 18568 / NBRC 106333 / KACC 11606 / 5516J-15) TaxID=1223518 RepID=A0A511N237_DEIC1|nr:MFS transporter [Deinococcus cellulosilyticus]GEM46925.1 MFS transporter [Deinococcus cellulosilyticus NBRC 106333 = KACC 11606]
MQRSVSKNDARPTGTALSTLSLAYFMLGTSTLSVVALSTPISHDLHVTGAQTGLLVTAFSLTFAVSALLSPLLVGHWPRKWLLLGGIALLVVGLLLGAAAPSFPLLLLTRIIAGIGGALLGPVLSATASMLVPPQQQQQALSRVFSGFTLSSVLGIPFTSVIGPLLGWRGTLLLLSVLLVVTAILIWKLVPHIAGGNRVTPATYQRVSRTPGLFPALGTTLLQIGGVFVLYAVIGSYLTQRFDSSPTWISATFLAFGIAGVLGNALVGTLNARLGNNRMLLLGLAGGAFAILTLLLDPAVPLAGLLSFMVLSFFAQMFQTPQQERMIRLNPAERNLMLGFNSATVYLGISLGSGLGSQLLATLGSQWLAAPALLMMLGGLLLTMTVVRANRNRAAAVDAAATD